MATKKKMLMSAAGNAGGAGLDVDEVFSTYLYTGNSSTQTITNGIDLAGEGGLVWSKRRSSGNQNILVDTERGTGNGLRSNATSASISENSVVGFNSDGYDLGNESAINYSGSTNASWTFRKAPKFFDVVTYTGNGSNRTIAHNLGSDVGMLIVKRLDSAKAWAVFHRQFNSGSSPANYWDQLNNAQAIQSNSTIWNNTAPTSSVFSVGTANVVNQSGGTYVAYLFAHNDGDGDFGPDGDADIIKCGSYTGNGSTNGPEIDLGFEPQWLLWKRTDSSANWGLIDNMRGFVSSASGYDDAVLLPNDSAAEALDRKFSPLSTGFQPNYNGSDINASGGNYIYIAIRRGPLAVPEDATEVFGMDDYTGGGDGPVTGFVTDFALFKNAPESAVESFIAMSRLTGQEYLLPSSTAAGATLSNGAFDRMDGAGDTGLSGYNIWGWKRAPGYFDAVAYTGDNSSNNHHTIDHNLGVAPEMIWFKRRDSTGGWGVLVTALGTVESGGIEYGQGAYLNEASAFALSGWWGSPYIAPTATEFTVRGSTPNASGGDYIAYLFASAPGVSKVGSYTGTGNTLNIDCGFSSGARFVLIRRTNGNGDWMLFDTERGIVSGNDPFLMLNETNSENSGQDLIDPYSSGFTLTNSGNGNVNGSGGSYIFYAIA